MLSSSSSSNFSYYNNHHPNATSTSATSTNNTTPTTASMPLSLRDEAALRAATVQQQQHIHYQPYYDHGDDDYYESFPQRPARSFAESSYHSASVTQATVAQTVTQPQPQQQYHQHHHQQQQYQHQQQQQQHPLSSNLGNTTTNNRAAANRAATSQDARKEWRQHGTGLTQALQDQATAGMMMSVGNNTASSAGTGIMARVISHVNRVDLGGHPYTAYVIQVTYTLPTTTTAITTNDNGNNNKNNSNSPSYGSTQIERRYSDFDKLHTILEPYLNNLNNNNNNNNTNQNSISLSSYSFPSKHWAGSRWGNRWLLSEEKQQEIADYRVIQLDVWMVQVLRAYNSGQLLAAAGGGADAQMAVYNFLFSSQAPCDHALILHNNNNNNKNSTSTSSSATNTSTSSGSTSKFHNPWTTTLGSSLRQALHTLELLTSQRDASIPCDLLHSAQGLLFLTVVKAGFMVSGRVGTGLIVAKLNPTSNNNNNRSAPSSWSAPCAISVMGMGWGVLAGGDVTHYLVVLTTQKATYDLLGASSHPNTGGGSGGSMPRLQLGAELGVAVGPIGRGANSHLQTGDWTVHPAYAYAISQGLFMGISLEGSVLKVRDDVNAVFYGRPGITASQILQLPGCKAAEPLYQAIEKAIQVEIPDGAFRPSQYFSSTIATATNNNVTPKNGNYYHYSYNNNNINNHAAPQSRTPPPPFPTGSQQTLPQQPPYYYTNGPSTPSQQYAPYTQRV